MTFCEGHEDLSDADLVALFQQGRTEAFGVLYARHVGAVTRVCRARLWDADAVQDAVQETFARVLRRLPHFAGGDLLGHYAHKVARLVCIEHVRRGLRAAEVGLRAGTAAAVVDPMTTEAAYEDRDAVALILAGLSAGEAALLREHHMDDEPVSVLAARRDSTPGSIRVRLHNARRHALRVARARGLHGLAPVFALRRWLRRAFVRVGLAPAEPLLAGIAAPMAVVIALLAPGQIGAGPSHRADAGWRPAVSARADTLTRAGAGTGAGTGVRQPPAAPRHRDAAADGSRRARPHGSAAPAVAVPLLPVPSSPRLHQEAPPRPDMTYGLRVGPDDDPVLDVGTHVADDPDNPVDEAACTAARTSPALTYCERRD